MKRPYILFCLSLIFFSGCAKKPFLDIDSINDLNKINQNFKNEIFELILNKDAFISTFTNMVPGGTKDSQKLIDNLDPVVRDYFTSYGEAVSMVLEYSSTINYLSRLSIYITNQEGIDALIKIVKIQEDNLKGEIRKINQYKNAADKYFKGIDTEISVQFAALHHQLEKITINYDNILTISNSLRLLLSDDNSHSIN